MLQVFGEQSGSNKKVPSVDKRSSNGQKDQDRGDVSEVTDVVLKDQVSTRKSSGKNA